MGEYPLRIRRVVEERKVEKGKEEERERARVEPGRQPRVTGIALMVTSRVVFRADSIVSFVLENELR